MYCGPILKTLKKLAKILQCLHYEIETVFDALLPFILLLINFEVSKISVIRILEWLRVIIIIKNYL